MDLSHLDGAFGWPGTVFTGLFTALIAAGGWLGRKRIAAVLRLLEQRPQARNRYYTRVIVNSWVMALPVPVLLLAEPSVTPADLGLRWPAGDGMDYLVSGTLLIAMIVGGLVARSRVRNGRRILRGNAFRLLLPQTRSQRWLALGLAVTAGIVEEAVFRGLLIAAGVGALGFSLVVSALFALALFVWAHLYQGIRGMLGVTYLGALFTGVYLISGSLLLPIILHAAQDATALLLMPAKPATSIRQEAAPEVPEAPEASAIPLPERALLRPAAYQPDA
jgi:membrane protease YdiL (CAAX protease family)